VRPLMRLFDAVLAAALQQSLDAEGIESQMTTERENAYLGRMECVVWVPEDADPRKVESACQAAWTRQIERQKKQQAERLEKPVTRVSIIDDVLTCAACGYDLRGQVTDGKCPECGHPYRIVGVKICPDCGAEMPSDFEVCWSCGGAENEDQ
jgi:rubrerythrin